ncbi:glycerol-3-phosphate 1-O-acyltransferase PlsY [Roseovarius nubinhibens]|uniref:Glycerol-3-phosphate acyltransferase n=1 Tax=Roseovarius nubinhibens TaxID=314263 RepID=A0A348W6W3_9RHOB|nr:acyl-phosphate glycerol 3-phosphate acyltransferase [Roseovarius nubinhibens]|tara:strand:- start:653 stop:1258 length:606 start_codon:yes stop_codon:yes gene_type:complete
MPPIDTAPLTLLLWAVLGYLLGSIPFGIVITRAMGLGNLREIGSGNIGTTNVLRTGSKGAALATLVLDGAKGAVAALLARAMAGEDAAQIAGLMAFAGHCFPVWLGFRGGKGVATFLGLLLALAWPVGIAACATWLVTAIIARISSLSALMAAALAPVWIMFLGHGEMLILSLILGGIIFWRHKDNIARLRAGTEPKIGKK